MCDDADFIDYDDEQCERNDLSIEKDELSTVQI